MAATTVIRPRTTTDLDELEAMVVRVRMVDRYPVHLPDGDARRFLTDPRPLGAWVADDGGRVVGHVAVNALSNQPVMDVVREAGIDVGVESVESVESVGRAGFIARLLVDPDERRKGLGTQLLRWGERRVLSLGRIPVLDVVASATPAVSLYRTEGWREIGTARIEVPGQVITERVFTTQT